MAICHHHRKRDHFTRRPKQVVHFHFPNGNLFPGITDIPIFSIQVLLLFSCHIRLGLTAHMPASSRTYNNSNIPQSRGAKSFGQLRLSLSFSRQVVFYTIYIFFKSPSAEYYGVLISTRPCGAFSDPLAPHPGDDDHHQLYIWGQWLNTGRGKGDLQRDLEINRKGASVYGSAPRPTRLGPTEE